MSRLSSIVGPLVRRQGSNNSIVVSDEENKDSATPIRGVDAQVALAKKPGNNICADCGFPGPQWAVEHIGAFVCTKCSGVHRQISDDPSKITSVSLAEWSLETLKHMTNRGNVVVNKEYEANLPENAKPNPESSFRDTFTFIKSKYKEKKFHKDRPARFDNKPPSQRRQTTTSAVPLHRRDGSSRDLVEGEVAISPLVRSKSAPNKAMMSPGGTLEDLSFEMEERELRPSTESEHVAMLNLRLIKGKHLPAADMNGLSDPYVRFVIEDKHVQSEVQHKTLNPVWKEKFQMELTKNDLKRKLRVEVYDFDVISNDDFLGYGEICIGDLLSDDTMHCIEMPISLEGVMMKQRMLMQPDFTWGRKWVKNATKDKSASNKSYSNLNKEQKKEYNLNDKSINPHAIPAELTLGQQINELYKKARKAAYFYFGNCCQVGKPKEEPVILFKVQLQKLVDEV